MSGDRCPDCHADWDGGEHWHVDGCPRFKPDRVKGDKGIGGHHRAYRGRSDDWLTPPEIIEDLGPFDLDPCAAIGQPWSTARLHYTIEQDGLAQQWEGRVWLNPPYGPVTWQWLERLADHGDGIALVFARTETAGFFELVWGRADALFFIKGRLHFHHPDGQRAKHNAGGPSVLIAYGEENVERLQKCSLTGAFTKIWRSLNG